MDLLLILSYAALCIGIFKLFNIPLNKWTVPTAVLGGIILIGTLIFTMNYNHPFSELSRTYFITTPIVPSVSGRVVEVPASEGRQLKQGEVLFRIDPLPFENQVKMLRSRLAVASEDLQRATSLVKKGVGNIRDRDLAQGKVDELSAQLANAEYDLQQTVVRAPTDGYITQVALRPGAMAVKLPLRPSMVFVHRESHYLIGWYRQNSSLRLKTGYAAEVAFDAIPGTVFSARVSKVLPAISEGQVQASGTLLNPMQTRYPGRIPVIMEIDDPRFNDYQTQLPGGAFAQTAIYSEHFQHVAIMRKILLRMASWMNYLFPFH